MSSFSKSKLVNGGRIIEICGCSSQITPENCQQGVYHAQTPVSTRWLIYDIWLFFSTFNRTVQNLDIPTITKNTIDIFLHEAQMPQAFTGKNLWPVGFLFSPKQNFLCPSSHVINYPQFSIYSWKYSSLQQNVFSKNVFWEFEQIECLFAYMWV